MVIYDSIVKADAAGSTWLVKAHSDQAVPVRLRFFKDGVAAGEVSSADGTFEFVIGPFEDWEVLDRDVQVPRFAVPSRWTLYWTEVTGTVYYRVDELVAAVWTERGRVSDLGQGHFTFLTGVLEDTTLYNFRVVPVAAGDLEAAAIPFAATAVRRPDPPAVTFSYSAGTGKVTIAAA